MNSLGCRRIRRLWQARSFTVEHTTRDHLWDWRRLFLLYLWRRSSFFLTTFIRVAAAGRKTTGAAARSNAGLACVNLGSSVRIVAAKLGDTVKTHFLDLI